MSDILQTKLYFARRVTWLSYVLFLICLVSGSIASGTPMSLTVIACLPLILFLPGMARENPKSLTMLCFVTLFYFTVIVVNLWEPDRTVFDILSLVLIVTLFIAAMMLSRWLQHARRDAMADKGN